MDLATVRAAFEDQMRRNAVPGPEARVERDPRVTRMLGQNGGWAAILWSDLTEDDADAVIRAELERRSAGFFEWKHYSGDRPADLPSRLGAAGLRSGGAETVLVADLAELDLPVSAPAGVRLATVEDDAGVATMTGVHQAVFGAVHPGTADAVRAALALEPQPVVAVLAEADGLAVSAGRVEFHDGTEFASLWGGGTLPEWRRRGVFRALVGHRARLARERGFRYLQVDAMPASRPILDRMGFSAIAETTPFVTGD